MRLHHRFARVFGYDLLHIKRNHPSLESHLDILFRQLGVNLILDVGANAGQYVELLRTYGYKGYVVSFEPVAHNIEELNKKAENDPRWLICPYALGSENQTLDLNVTTISTFSSFHTPNKYAGELFAQKTPIEGVEQVAVKRLDDVFEEVCAFVKEETVVPYLKMDTQGFDLEVLKGAQESIEKIDAFQSEISLIPLYDGMPDYLEALATFRELGFSMTGLYTVTRDHSNQFLVELECVMRRLPPEKAL